MRTITSLVRKAQCHMMEPNSDAGEEARSAIEDMMYLFEGSGFEDAKFDFAHSKPNKLILTGSYHKMNEGGYYDGYADWKAIIRPDILDSYGFTCSVTTRNADSLLREYIWEAIHNVLTTNRNMQDENEPRRKTEIGELCNRIIARQNCYMSGNTVWLQKHDANIREQLHRMEKATGLSSLEAEYDRAKGTATISGQYEHYGKKVPFTAVVRPDFRLGYGFSVRTKADLAFAYKALLSASIAQYCSRTYEEPKEEAAPAMSM